MADRQNQSEILGKSGGYLNLADVKIASPGNESGQSGSRPSSTPSSSGKSPQKDYYWFAQAADLPSPSSEQKSTCNGGSNDQDGRESMSGSIHIDREERIRVLRERQSEERQRRLEDLKLAALHAQKVREQQEEDRRRKIEELKTRDQERRAMVEERKKLIWEAEKERREAILRKNNEREARIEARRNANRSSIGFAFGSCTPRLIDDNGYFNNRRSASQTNVMLISSNENRSSVEKELDFNKKRPSSSSFRIDHKAGDADIVHPSIYEIFHWPDINSQHFSHDSISPSFTSTSNIISSHSLNLNDPQPGPMMENSPIDLKSEYFPMHRADKFAGVLKGSGAVVGEDLMTKSLSALMGPPVRGRRKTDLTPTLPLHDSPRTHSPATRTTPSSPSRPNSSMSQQSLSSHASQNSTVSMRTRNTSYRPRPVSIAGTPTEKSPTAEERQGRSVERKVSTPQTKPPRAKSAGADQVISENNMSVIKPPSGVNKRMAGKSPSTRTSSTLPLGASKEKPKIPPKPIPKMSPKSNVLSSPSTEQQEIISAHSTDSEETPEVPAEISPDIKPAVTEELEENKIVSEAPEPLSNTSIILENEEVVTPVSKPRITTEEEAKAALAERRRLAREQLEREAEMERLRLEELKRQEEERIRQEEEERKRWEEEQDRLRQIESERLQKAIEEQRQKEEEEQKQKEEENRLKMEKEEADKKSREEQEKLRKETEERLRKEEEERAERRKRVEAIMSRTRGKGTNNTPVTTPTKGSDGVIGKFEEAKTGVSSEEIPIDTSSSVMHSDGLSPTKETTAHTTEMNIYNEQRDPQTGTTPQQSCHDTCDNISSKLIESFTENKNIDLVPLHSNGFADNEEKKEMKPDFIVDNKSSEKRISGTGLIESFESLKAKASSEIPQESVEFDQLIDLSVSNNSSLNTEDFLNNADNVNSNVPSNGPGAPFIAFEDNFTIKQETNVTDLL